MNDPLNPDIRLTRTHIVFKVGRKQVAQAAYSDLKLETSPGVSDLARNYMEIMLEAFVPGEVLHRKGHDPVVLGPPREFTHAVELHAVGNPDHGQYADIGPRKSVQTVGIDEAIKAFITYRDYYDMGGGNCARHHGRVWELTPKGDKIVGHISYNGGYKTLAEIEAQEAEWKSKYAKA